MLKKIEGLTNNSLMIEVQKIGFHPLDKENNTIVLKEVWNRVSEAEKTKGMEIDGVAVRLVLLSLTDLLKNKEDFLLSKSQVIKQYCTNVVKEFKFMEDYSTKSSKTILYSMCDARTILNEKEFNNIEEYYDSSFYKRVMILKKRYVNNIIVNNLLEVLFIEGSRIFKSNRTLYRDNELLENIIEDIVNKIED